MSEQPLLEVVSHIAGKNAKVRVYNDRVEWERTKRVSAAKITTGVFTAGMSLAATGLHTRKGAGTEVIPISAITSIATKRDTMLNDVVSVITSGNTIDMRCHRAEAQSLKSIVQRLMLERDRPAAQPSSPAPAAPPAATAPDLTAKLSQLAALHDQGILSDEEFASAKAKALGI